MNELMSKNTFSFDDLLKIMEILRANCPWDKEQTHRSLIEPLIEEAYELKQAIINNDKDNMSEELGDLLLQVVFHAQIGKDEEEFDINRIITKLCKKLIYRHPHIFTNEVSLENKEQVKNQWDQLKMLEKSQHSYSSVLESVPEVLPALIRAYKVQKKASKFGFDWDNISHVYDKVQEELKELNEAEKKGDCKEIEEEYGDLLFAIVNLSRFFKINPEFALTNATEKFINRFRYIENFANKSGRRLDDIPLEEMNILWEKAKSCT